MCPYGETCIWSNFDTMSAEPNKLSQFWKELKRRRVVITFVMYGATAFILTEAAVPQVQGEDRYLKKSYEILRTLALQTLNHLLQFCCL